MALSLIAAYDLASARAETAMRVARTGGDYPLLSRGDINLYSLFVERAQALIRADGLSGLLVPSTIMSGKDSSPFLEEVFTAERIFAGLEFFNRQLNGALRFSSVYWRYRFCALIVGGKSRTCDAPVFTFFHRGAAEPAEADMVELRESIIRAISPELFALPMFATEQDARISIKLFGSEGQTARFADLNLRYSTPYHMAGDSELFFTHQMLAERNAYPVELGLWLAKGQTFDRLFEGKVVQAFDHRAASVRISDTRTFRTGETEPTTLAEHEDASFVATPRFFVADLNERWRNKRDWTLALKDITSVTNTRTTIACIIPRVGAGHSLPLFIDGNDDPDVAVRACANLNSLAFDYAARFRVQTNHLTWFILRSLPVIPPDAYARRFGARTAGEIVRDHVLRLSYTAHDLAPFARDLGHVWREGDADLPEGAAVGDVRPPFRWDEDERRRLRARLDALYFLLYGLTDRGDVRHVLSTFPIVRRKDVAHVREAYGPGPDVYLTQELVLWYMSALEAGDDARDPPLDQLIAAARRREA